MERKLNGDLLVRWLVVPSSFTSTELYSNSIQLRIPVSSVIEEFKTAKCRMIMTLRTGSEKTHFQQCSKALAAERRTMVQKKIQARRKINGKQDQQNLKNTGPG